jgi:hypothetical protein
MRVYQAIHKYRAYVDQFEAKYGITDDTDFESLRRIVVDDGYASSYILQPALDDKPEQVFYTVWDYDRLQRLWAKEKGLKSRDLVEIKLAQIEEYRPDVFYNMSAVYDNHFIKRLGKRKGRKDIYWNGIIESEPKTFLDYDGQLSLHRPYVEYWTRRGLRARELQPGMPKKWSLVDSTKKSVDALFYGQYVDGMFDNRNRLIEDLLRYKRESGLDIRCHLDYTEKRPTIISIPKLPWANIRSSQITFPPAVVRHESLRPLYGDALYDVIAQARIVVNAYTDNNRDFKSNMRLFEAIGLGAFLISEVGTYPDGFEPGVDFYTYDSAAELICQIERVLGDWSTHAQIAEATRRKISRLYSKERQWQDFSEFAVTL